MKQSKRRLKELTQQYLDRSNEQDPAIIGYFDGACEPMNPGGNMGIGSCFRCGGEEVFRHSKFVPPAKSNSNNVAEYLAFEALLDWLQGNHIANRKIHICGDSKLVIMQMQGIWKMNGGYYIPYAQRCLEKLKGLRANNKLSFTLQWIPRGQNQYADELSKAELINHNVEFRIQPLANDYQK